MEVSRIIEEIDAQILKLTQARELLAGTDSTSKRKLGRPKGTVNAITQKAPSRRLSPEGRKRISETMKRRWAERRKMLAKSASSK